MNYTKGKVSVLMNCFNGEKYLEQAIQSVINQTYKNWEIILWDNQSTDNSRKIVEAFNNPQIKYFYSEKHTILYEARKLAIQKAGGEFIGFLDVDDYWEAIKLECQMSSFNDSQIALVYSNYWEYNEILNKRKIYFNGTLPNGYIFNELCENYTIGILTVIIRRNTYDSLNEGFNSNFHMIGDFDLILRLAKNNKIKCIQKPLATYRIHENNETIKKMNLQLMELIHWKKKMINNEILDNTISIRRINKIINSRRMNIWKNNIPLYRLFSHFYRTLKQK
jgi:glycosyltransferase involved in cell wall biosynthesis